MDTFVVMLILCLYPCCTALQNEKCNFSVVMMETAENFTCFKKMSERTSICTSNQSTPLCHIDYRNGNMCLKWPSNIELTCVNDSPHRLEEEGKCARDQESISCDGEYTSDFLLEPRDSVSTLSMKIPLTTACAFMTIILWMSL